PPDTPERMARGLPAWGIGSWIRPDGKENYYEWTAIAMDVANQKYVLGVDRDVTAERKAAEALRQNEKLLELVLQHSSDGICLCKLDEGTHERMLVMCNDRYVEMSGRTREELMAAEDLNAFVEEVWTVPASDQGIGAGLHVRGVASWIRPDGKENYYEWVCAPARFEGELHIIGVDRDITERMRSERALHAARLKIVMAREQERKRLAEELHDSIGQQTVAMHLALARIQADAKDCANPEVPAGLARLAALCDEMTGRIREVSRGLYPPMLEALGLVTALQQLAHDCRPATRAEVDCPKDIAEARFPGEVEIALYRIAQEAVSNAIRHGRPGRIELRLRCGSGKIRMVVRDDGIGFEPAEVHVKGLGLHSMKERAEAVGGVLQIRSRPGDTRIVVQVPAELLERQ
ncbi:MAG TPA: PAS domain-containing sensor histidine kinase, partial [Phycisphaerae bacterium]|nr:PAS domain-containing sensor histidine kinase [Phycisphaerae bacterium]